MIFRWNQLDVGIVFLSVVGIVMEELESDLMPINPTIMRVMRVLRIARGNLSNNFFKVWFILRLLFHGKIKPFFQLQILCKIREFAFFVIFWTWNKKRKWQILSVLLRVILKYFLKRLPFKVDQIKNVIHRVSEWIWIKCLVQSQRLPQGQRGPPSYPYLLAYKSKFCNLFLKMLCPP